MSMGNITNALPAGCLLKGNSYTYEIVKALGQGSFGITYLATTMVKVSGALGELEVAMQVAVKELFMKEVNGRNGTTVTCGSRDGVFSDYKRQFVREARNLSHFSHPHIVKVLESFEANGTAYFSMEFIDGESLCDYIKMNGGLSDREALGAVGQVGEALAAMHRDKMLHLDLKPLNVMRRKNGELVLIDFGLSKLFSADGVPESSTSIGFGTRGFAPMEQANYKRGSGFPATLDVYALGATLFNSLVGYPPPEASDVYNEGFPESDMRKAGVAEDVIRLTSWAMEPKKSERPQSVGEFLRGLERILPTASARPRRSPEPIEVSPQLSSAKPVGVTHEECNGLKIRWAADVSEKLKDAIRKMVGNIKVIGNKDQIVYGEYGPEVVASYPVMSVGDETNFYVEQFIWPAFVSTSDPFDSTIRNILEVVRLLEVWTGLPFRLAEKRELAVAHSYPVGTLVETLFYSKQDGLCCGISMCDENVPVRFEKITYPRQLKRESFDFHIVCDRPTPVYGERGFDVPCTQAICHDIQPIGFGLYKIRIGAEWNITSPKSPLARFLPKGDNSGGEGYDSISPIMEYTIPGPGPSGLWVHLGVTAKKGNVTSYFDFEDGGFELAESYTDEELSERSMFT